MKRSSAVSTFAVGERISSRLSASTAGTFEEIHCASYSTTDAYAIHTGDTPGLHRSLTAPTPSGRRVSNAGGRQEGVFVTPTTPTSYAPHQSSPYAFRSGHQVGTSFHRLRELDAALLPGLQKSANPIFIR